MSWGCQDGATTSIIELIAGDGGDGSSLCEAVLVAKAAAGADEITFAPALSGQTIEVGGTELEITEALSIEASSRRSSSGSKRSWRRELALCRNVMVKLSLV